MNQRYKIILSGKHIYKEIELAQNAQQVKVGTELGCDVRLHRGLFFEPFELVFVNAEGNWNVYCSDNLYLTAGDIRKFESKKLSHGDVLEVKYQETNSYVFSMDFLIDFDDGKKKYERAINVGGAPCITIGGTRSNQIAMGSPYVYNDQVQLVRQNNGFVLKIQKTTYGVYINGGNAKTGDVLHNGDFLTISDFSFYYKDNALWTEIRPDLALNGLSYEDKTSQGTYPRFNRNTRIKTVVGDEKIDFLDPPSVPEKPKTNIIQQLLPSLGMLLAAAIMVILYHNATMIIMSGITGTISIGTGIMTIVNNKKDYKRKVEERNTTYRSYVSQKRVNVNEKVSQSFMNF